MKQNQRICSNPWRLATLTLLDGLLLGFFFDILLLVLGILGLSLPAMLAALLRWPTALVSGWILSLVCAACCFCSLTKDGETITFYTLWKRRIIPPQCQITQSRQTRVSLDWGIKLVLRRYYLHLSMPDQPTRRYRLFAFNDQAYLRLEQWLRHRAAEEIPLYDRVAQNYQTQEDAVLVSLPVAAICADERKVCLRNTLLLLGLLLLTLALYLGTNMQNKLLIGGLCVACACLLLISPVLFVQLGKNKTRCPAQICLQGNFIRIDRQHFSLASIVRVELTAPACRSHSMYPVQRFLTIIDETGRHRFWLGSEGCCFAPDYPALCDAVEAALLLYPQKLRYVNTTSFLST